MTSLELNDREKDIFLSWLQEREKAIAEEMDVLKNLRSKLQNKKEVIKPADENQSHPPVAKTVLHKKEDESSSWVNTIKKQLEHFSHPVPSGEIVKQLLQQPKLAEKGKRFITKAVTSKLWLLQERGEVIKTRENGKYVYSLKK